MTTLVATNGVFDCLHRGHCLALRQARAFGDALIVGINSDRSVGILKPGRPIHNEQDRKFVLESLAAVSHVEIFDDVRATAFLKKWKPDVYCKSGYTIETLDPEERAALEEMGTRIVFLPLVPNLSTTAILEKLKR